MGANNIFDSLESRFFAKIDKSGDCWEWTASKQPRGYGTFKFRNASWLAHRVSYTINIGEIPINMHVLHRCDNPPCVNPDHLFIGTQADNNADMEKKGRSRYLRGEKNGKAKLTAEDVAFIRKSNKPLIELAQHFNVSKSHIGAIRCRQKWKHIP